MIGKTCMVLTNPPRQARPLGGPVGKKGVFTVSRPPPPAAPLPRGAGAASLSRGGSVSVRDAPDEFSSVHSGSTRGAGGREYGVIYFELGHCKCTRL